MTDKIGRDKINQTGYNPKLTIDNRDTKNGGKWSSKIIIGVVVAVIAFIVNYYLGFLLKSQNDISLSNMGAVDKFFPIKRGNYWKYEGIRKEDTGGGKIETSNIQKRIEILDIQETENGKLILLSGSDSTKYLVKGSTLDFEPDNSSNNKFVLSFPLQIGQKWGDENSLKRDDGFYIYQVEEKSSREIQGKKYNDCFRITYKGIPDTSFMVFCYGIGIVEEEYKHNGTVLEWNYELIDSNIE